MFCNIILFKHANIRREVGFEIWTTANGLPQNTVTAGVVQTPEGYLRLSTFNGPARFAGVQNIG